MYAFYVAEFCISVGRFVAQSVGAVEYNEYFSAEE